MPKVSEEYLTERQNQILDAAVRRFSAGGFHATGMADIIAESGLSAGSVYRYYRSKDDLIAAIVTRLLAEFHGRLSEASADATTPAEAIERALQVAAQSFISGRTDDARLLPQVWTEALRNPAIQAHVQASYGQIIEHFHGLARRMEREGTLPPDLDPRGTAHVMLAAVQGFMLQRLLLTKEFDATAYLAAARRIYETDSD